MTLEMNLALPKASSMNLVYCIFFSFPGQALPKENELPVTAIHNNIILLSMYAKETMEALKQELDSPDSRLYINIVNSISTIHDFTNCFGNFEVQGKVYCTFYINTRKEIT